MVVGAGLSSAAYVAAGELKPAPTPPAPSATMEVFQLAYQRPGSPSSPVFAGVSDPLKGPPSQAIAELATSCGLREYTLEAHDQAVPGWNAAANLYIHPATLSDEAYNCLSEKVRPPYLRLIKVERCRRLMERNSGAPPCPVVVY